MASLLSGILLPPTLATRTFWAQFCILRTNVGTLCVRAHTAAFPSLTAGARAIGTAPRGSTIVKPPCIRAHTFQWVSSGMLLVPRAICRHCACRQNNGTHRPTIRRSANPTDWWDFASETYKVVWTTQACACRCHAVPFSCKPLLVKHACKRRSPTRE
jgi:hypothetical protein